MKKLMLLISHGLVGFAGFALGVYLLPILIQPQGPSEQEISSAVAQAQFEGQFVKELKGSDFLHWGEGSVMLGGGVAAFKGKLAPGPDYKLYLSPVFVDDEMSFLENKRDMVQVAEIKTFDGFVVNLPEGVDLAKYSTAVIWCETFSEFISAARYNSL
ncbi:DM13 domain-containing protein [Neptuniibacter sp. SY11_33]|uniref:DM13 domain-containing protein n=1 Tax=Neptuniibacter sp. SY11_33 TaxID=3398215 RepID=UPI0039F5023B